MAGKSVYQEYNEDALNHFGLAGQPLYGLVTSNVVEDVLITQHQTTFDKIRDLLSDNTPHVGQTTTSILSGYKKAFVLPRCPVSLDRVKAACKEHSITITNDYTKADLVITHYDFYEKFNDGSKIKTSTLMYRLWNYEAFSDSLGRWALIDNHDKPVIYDEKWTERGVNSYSLSDATSLYDEWGIPGLALNIAHLIDTNQLEVMNVDDVLRASANVTELTETLVKDLTSWIESYDSDNIAIAAKIIPTIDYSKKPHLLWELAQSIYHRTHKFNRDKDVQHWLDKSQIGKLYHYSAQDMILNLEKDEKLTSESFKYLEPIVRKEIRIDNRDLYVFKVSVKEEYKKYLK